MGDVVEYDGDSERVDAQKDDSLVCEEGPSK